MQHILLLHGALGQKNQFKDLVPLLEQKNYLVHALNLYGHGSNTGHTEPFSMALFAQHVLAYIEAHSINKATILGYSMGGFVAAYLACYFPDKVTRVITLGTKFEWTPEVAAKELRLMDPEQILLKVPAFAEKLAQDHAPGDWKELLSKTGKLLVGLGEANPLTPEKLATIQVPFLITIGDRDKMIPLEECARVYRSLPNAALAVLPGTGHLIEKVDWARFVGVAF